MAGRQDAFQQAMNQGHSAAWDGRWDRAAAFYRQALEEDPQSSAALTNLGLANIELQDFDEALKCYQKAAKLAPEDPLPLEKVAQLCERMGNLDLASQASLRAAELYLKNRDANKAIENWERVNRLTPENVQAHARLALVFERLGDKPRAASEYLAMAGLLQHNGEAEKAAKAVQQALTILPESEEAVQAVNLLKDFKPLPLPARPRGATAPLRMSQVRQLQSPLDREASLSDQDPISATVQKALTVLAGMLFDSAEDVSELPSTRRGLQAIVTGSLDPNAVRSGDRTRMILHLSQVVDLQTRGEKIQAADELQHAIEAGLDHAAAAFDLGYLYAEAGRLESAVRQLQNALKHPDFAFGAHLLLGDLLRKKGQLKEASIEYLEALKLADSLVVPVEQSAEMLQLYDLLIESQRYQNDVDALNRICNNIHDMLNQPGWQTQLVHARQQLPHVEGRGTQVPLAEVLVEARSSQVISSVSSIYQMVQRGQVRTAMEEAFYAIDSAPTYLPLHALMAEMEVQANNIPTAVEKFQVIARTFAMRGDAQQAINYARRVVELSPTDMNARLKLIDFLVSFGKAEAAIDVYITLAETYFSQAELSLARKTYTDALRVAQQTNVERTLRIKILHRMADIDLQSLEWRQGLRVLEQIRTLQPDDPESRSQVIALNFRLGQEAQALAELDNYSAYLNGKGRQDELIRFIEELVTEYNERIPVRRRLADAYRQAGRIDQAVSQLDSIGEIFLQANDRPAAIQTIETIIGMNPPNKGEYEMLLAQLRRG